MLYDSTPERRLGRPGDVLSAYLAAGRLTDRRSERDARPPGAGGTPPSAWPPEPESLIVGPGCDIRRLLSMSWQTASGTR